MNDFGNRRCKREGVEDNALKKWKRSIFTIVDKRIKFYSQNTNLLPPKPKSSIRHLKQGIQEFHRKYVLVPADKKVQVGKDQEKAQSERDSHSKNRGGKKPN